jgi:hypothetical protein
MFSEIFLILGRIQRDINTTYITVHAKYRYYFRQILREIESFRQIFQETSDIRFP